jgi:predicted RecA/RadA family phage recombinase
MKKSLFLAVAAVAALAAFAAHAFGVDVVHAASVVQHSIHAHVVANPDLAIGLAGLGAAGITTFVQPGDVLDLDPGATVPSGTGHLFGAALFGVAAVDAVSGTASAFIVEGVVTIGKTSALAISVGDRLFWDATNSVVNKTATAQQQVGIAVEAAANPSSTVKMLIESAVPVAT